MTPKARNRISSHMKDLLGKNVQAVQEVADWLKPRIVAYEDENGVPVAKHRDRVHRTGGKLMARYIAAKTILAAAEEGGQALLQLLERTEGKVAQPIQAKEVPILVQFNFGAQTIAQHGAPELAPAQPLLTDGEPALLPDPATETTDEDIE